MTKKVLITFVGTQDPVSYKTHEEGAIVTLVRMIHPDVVVMLYSAKLPSVLDDTEENARNTEHWIRTEVDPTIELVSRALLLKDPTDYNLLLPVGLREIQSIIDLIGSDCEFHVNASSGTPQMKACMLLWCNEGLFPHCTLHQVRNPQYVDAGESRICPVAYGFFEEHNFKNRAVKLAHQGFYGLAAEQLTALGELTRRSERFEKARFFARLLEAYHHWDLVHYREAHSRLEGLHREYGNKTDIGEMAGLLARQCEYLRSLGKGDARETPQNLVDLYFNAKRRFDQMAYTDTLTRFWRILEGLLQFRLADRWGIDAHSPSASRAKELVETVRNKVGNNMNVNTPWSLHYCEKALQALGDPVMRGLATESVQVNHSNSTQSIRLSRQLEHLRTKRNSSIAAHGMEPVDRMAAESSIEVAGAAIKLFLGDVGESLLNDYPLSPENVLLVSRYMEGL